MNRGPSAALRKYPGPLETGQAQPGSIDNALHIESIAQGPSEPDYNRPSACTPGNNSAGLSRDLPPRAHPSGSRASRPCPGPACLRASFSPGRRLQDRLFARIRKRHFPGPPRPQGAGPGQTACPARREGSINNRPALAAWLSSAAPIATPCSSRTGRPRTPEKLGVSLSAASTATTAGWRARCATAGNALRHRRLRPRTRQYRDGPSRKGPQAALGHPVHI